MPYVVTIEDVAAPARYTSPPTPWVAARIAEAPVEAGPFSTVDTVLIDPVDADPSAPAQRSFTTSSATLPAGWYRVTLLDQAGGEFVLPAVRNGGALDAEFVPSVQDVADLLRTRTRDANGAELGQFTAESRPTREQVEALIPRAVRAVAARVGRLPGPMSDVARYVAALQTALLVELSFFPDQVATDRSPYSQLKALHDEQVGALASLGAGGGDTAGAGGSRGVSSVPVSTLLTDPLYDYLAERDGYSPEQIA